MKVIDYKQLCKAPQDTLFSTLSKMNEYGEVLVIGQYPDRRKFLYSPLTNTEIAFDENTYSRTGSFVVWDKDELNRFKDKLEGVLSFNTGHGIHETPATPDNLIVPIYRTESAKHFVAADLVPPTTMLLDGVEIETAPLAMGAHYSLLGISQTQSLLETGLMDVTDSIDPDIKLGALYIYLEALGFEDEVVKVNVSDFGTAQATANPPNSLRHMQILFREDLALLAGMHTVAGEGSKILTNGWVLPKVTVSGMVHLEIADAAFTAQRLEPFHQYHSDVNVRARVIGYDLLAKRVNYNRRPRLAA